MGEARQPWLSTQGLRLALAAALGLLLAATSVEVLCQVRYRLRSGRWLGQADPAADLFRPHPYLVALPAPSIDRIINGTRVRHNALGWRGPEFSAAKAPGLRRVLVLGGSSTYCTQVGEGDTWPERLGAALGQGWEVVNLGVPGYNTADHLIQTAFLVEDYEPDLVVYYVGWNDLRTSHVRGLAPGYANFHPLGNYYNLRVHPDQETGRWASLYYLRLLLEGRPQGWTPGGLLRPEGGPEKLTDHVDPRAMELYARNVRLLALMNRARGIPTLFVPQVMNAADLTGTGTVPWTPFVRDCDLPRLLAAYNGTLGEECARAGVPAVPPDAFSSMGPADFLDRGHFNARGCTGFARALAPYVAAQLGAAAPPGNGPDGIRALGSNYSFRPRKTNL